MNELVWIDGVRTPTDDATWAQAAAGFFGRGYRTSFPVTDEVPPALNFHRQMCERLATLLGQELDRAPWQFLEVEGFARGAAVEVVGGWRNAGKDLTLEPSSATISWTAIGRLGDASHDATRGAGVTLPYVYNSQSRLAGLPVVSRLEDDQAARYVSGAGADIGLWWTANGQLAASTQGAPLVQVGPHSWVFPERSAAMRSSWIFYNIASHLGSVPMRITEETLGECRTVAFIDSIGKVAVLTSLDDRPLTPDREGELAILTTRLGLIG